MQHPHEVDRVLAILDTQEIMVYGRDLRRPLVADGEDVPTSVARIPIRRPESVGGATARRSAGIVSTLSRTRAGWRMPS
jgi:hypothetical protein